MKKFFSVILLALLAFGALVGCAGRTYEIALVTDVGNIDDKSFNEGAWTGVKNYAEANDISYDYFRPAEDSQAARVETIEAAIDKGAKIVVCPGYLFETAIFEVQADYPDVAFLILDGEPNNGDFSNDGANLVYETADNVHCVLYQEEQAGFLAGYAAVQEGFRSLGFIGGMAVPAVIRYGYGYVQGAEKAAVDLGLATGAVTMKYYYVGAFEGSDALETKMDGWYAAGVEVIFSCGGKLYTSVVAAAANTTAGKVIGVDVDQQAESDRIITSAMKALTLSVEESLEAFFDNEKAWPATLAGKTRTMGAVENGIGLPTAAASWRMTNFTVTEYNALFADLVDGDIVVSASTAAEPTVTKIVVDYDA